MTIFEKWARVPARQPVVFHFVAALLVVVVSLLIYSRSLDYGYLDWDDNTLVEQNPYVIYPPYGQHMVDLFIPARTPGPHLPLRTATYIFDREFLGKGTPPQKIASYHHLTNVFLYVLNGLLLLWMLRKLLDPWAASIATLIWVAHPVHVEGVCWVSGRKEMLAGGFVFAALLAYMYGTEKLRDAGGIKPLMASTIGCAIAFLISYIAIFHPGHAPAGVQGLASLFILLGACVAYGVVAGGEKAWVAGSLLALSVFCALCGALSKPVAICIPPILLAWEIGYRPRRVIAEKPAEGTTVAHQNAVVAFMESHFFTVDEFRGLFARLLPHAFIALWGAYMTVGLAGKNQVLKSETWNAAPKNQDLASYSAIWLDIYHLVAPLKLSALYDVKSEVWVTWVDMWGMKVPWSAPGVGVAILIAIPILAFWLLRKSPKSLLWLAFWLVPLIPVSGIWRLASAHADRYLYIPAVALAVALGVLLASAAFGEEEEETGTWERLMAVVLCFAIVGGFSLLSFQRTHYWAKDEYLWGDAVEKNPDLPSARNNYGAALMNSGKAEEALVQYYKACELLPTLDVCQFNIAATEMRFGRPEKALPWAEKFSAQHPEMPTGWILLGQVNSGLAKKIEATDPAGAKAHVETASASYVSGCEVPVDDVAILQKQDKASACNQAAIQRAALGDDEGALKYFDIGLKNSPGNAQLVLNRAKFFRQKKQYDKAIAELMTVVSSGNPEIFRNLAQTYFDSGDKPRALEYMDVLIKSGRYTQRDFELYNGLKKLIEDEKNGLPLPGASPAPAKKKTASKADCEKALANLYKVTGVDPAPEVREADLASCQKDRTKSQTDCLAKASSKDEATACKSS